jgi:N-acetyl-anhydromuramyl-L-alanine amidase AmpD
MTHLGLELVQPKPDDTFSIEQLEAAAQVVAGWCRRYNIPLVHDPTAGLAGHDEIPPGIRDGKTDPGEMFPWGEFIPRVQRWYMVHGG